MSPLRKVAEGVQMDDVAEGRTVMSVPASEWFCGLGNDLSCQAIGALADMSGWSAAISLQRPGHSIVTLDNATRFLRAVRPDGRRLRSEATASEPAPDLLVVETRVQDADGRLVALFSGSAARIAAARRTHRERKESRRVLATLLFTDIVDSTGHAQRLGDADWRALLERHNLAVRREVSRYSGIEVDTAGDGFFVRFDSPAHALEAARAVRHVAAALGLAIRTGMHVGECELHGNTLAGMAVHVAARIQAAAQPGEILVSSILRELLLGSIVRFADKGERDLKGIPEPCRLFALAQ